MNLRQIGLIGAPIVLGYLLSLLAPSLGAYTPQLLIGLGLAAAAAIAVAASSSGGKGPSLAPLIEALRVASRGKRPKLPDGISGELAEAYEEIDKVAKRGVELTEEVARLEENAGGSTINVEALLDAAERASRGERSRAPTGSDAQTVQLIGELSALAERVAATDQESRSRRNEAQAMLDRATAAEAEAKAARDEIFSLRERLTATDMEAKASRNELSALKERLYSAESDSKAGSAERATLVERMSLAETELKQRRAENARDLSDLVEAAMRASEGERVRPPPGASSEAARVYGELAALSDRMIQAEQRDKQRRSELVQASGALEDQFPRLQDGVGHILQASEQASEHIRDMTTALANIAQSIESLASSAEESSSSILEMTATNDETAENVGELANSVRETVSSIEEMAYSIREVAKNVDALSLTAEETSSSMNEMDVSIDQVQSNANETARLSEEVATDAEKGAEAILKTIGEIYRIKESSQEAVAVISNLGFRIEAIGQILAVIDDVAEQTNLLALNAAIIAAQAGEHGKGFAVVADEIKDLAERAGGSTKEIAELIKTIQSESKNAIAAVERGAHNVDRGVEVSNEAERALKKILESSQKSTNMVRAIARATVEQAKGSKQVTDAIGRIAETVQQIAAATAEQARGSELIMKSAEKMRTITQHVERSSQEQARGGRQITTAIEQISNMVNNLNSAQRTQMRGGEQLLDAARRIEESARMQEQAVRQLVTATERLRRAVA
ncbi:Methyl-accepting chemotaxis protein [Minicystis rosea]|nr:Methyl-accepting chemotaxis protein [Minicystis rosea]